MRDVFLIFLGGGAGSALRYLIKLAMGGVSRLPLATFIVNLFGALIIGIFIAKFGDNRQHWAHLMVAIGFCGGFTTFSTFSLEVLELAKTHSYTIAALYAFASVVVSVLAVVVGMWLYRTYSGS